MTDLQESDEVRCPHTAGPNAGVAGYRCSACGKIETGEPEKRAIGDGRMTQQQQYGAWFTQWPSTHERAGETVEVVPRGTFEVTMQDAQELFKTLDELTEALGHLRIEGEVGRVEDFHRACYDAEVLLQSLDADYGP